MLIKNVVFLDAKNTISWHQALVSPRLILDLQGKTWLCGLCAARPAPHIVKHARATQTSTHRARKAHTLTELGKHTQKSANIRTTHNVVRMLALFCVCFPRSGVLDDVRRARGSGKPAKPSLALQLQNQPRAH